MSIQCVQTFEAGQPIGQCRAVPLSIGGGGFDGFVAVLAADFDVDPFEEMFYFPTDTLKLIAFGWDGRELWRRDLGRGVVPGLWFCPVLTCDLDEDGVDEVYFVDNVNTAHPLSRQGARLTVLDGRTGAVRAQHPWTYRDTGGSLGRRYRNFLVAGRVAGRPVLVAAQGTYEAMRLEAFDASMAARWTHDIAADQPGARGSHMCPVVDLDGDGSDELFWGERCIRLDTGEQMFCADESSYRGHSDIVQPVLDRGAGAWSIYTCRESDGAVAPRIALFDQRGRRRWGHVDQGHIDMGWVGRIGDDGRQVATAVRIGGKSCGPDGRHHEGVDEFTFDVATGAPVDPPFRHYRTLPIDVDGDGRHELLRGQPSGDGKLFGRDGRQLADLGGPAAMVGKLIDHPGEQALTYHPDGRLCLWADGRAEDTDAALARYRHPFYRANQRLTAVGYNLVNLGGV